MPPAALISSSARSKPFFHCAPYWAYWPVSGPLTPIRIGSLDCARAASRGEGGAGEETENWRRCSIMMDSNWIAAVDVLANSVCLIARPPRCSPGASVNPRCRRAAMPARRTDDCGNRRGPSATVFRQGPSDRDEIFRLFAAERSFSRPHRLDAGLAQGRAESRIRRGHRRRRRARARDRVLSRDRCTASPMWRCWRRATSAPAMRAATPPSSAPTTCCPATSRFYEWSMKLWEGLEQDFNYNAMVSQRGVLNLYHSDAQRDAYARRGNAMRLHGVDAELLDRDGVRRMVPFLDYDNARFPIQGGLLQRRGGTARHDAVVWGYARGADMRGVDIIENCEVTGFDIDGRPRRPASTPRAARSGRRRSASRSPATPRASRRWPGLRLPIESHVLQAFVSEGIKPAIDQRRDLRRRALLHQPVRQGRAGVRRRYRRLQLLCVARQPADRRGRDGRRHGDLARASGASACCASGAG